MMGITVTSKPSSYQAGRLAPRLARRIINIYITVFISAIDSQLASDQSIATPTLMNKQLSTLYLIKAIPGTFEQQH